MTENFEIAISQHSVFGRSVDGRELHKKLNSGQDFSDWIKARIAAYGFEEGVDFIKHATVHKTMDGGNEVSHKTMENSKGGRPATEYTLTLDMAKELSMVERTDVGKIARQYFIACEKKLHEVVSEQNPMITNLSPSERLLAMSEQYVRLGYSTGVAQAAMLEVDSEHFETHGVHLLPHVIRKASTNDVAVTVYNRSLSDTTTQAARVIGADFRTVTVSDIVDDLDLSKRGGTLLVNDHLIRHGLQRRIAHRQKQRYTPCFFYVQTLPLPVTSVCPTKQPTSPCRLAWNNSRVVAQ